MGVNRLVIHSQLIKRGVLGEEEGSAHEVPQIIIPSRQSLSFCLQVFHYGVCDDYFPLLYDKTSNNDMVDLDEDVLVEI